MTLATKDVVSSFVGAWDYMTGQYPGHLHARTPGLAVSLSQTSCSFFNMLVVDRPIDSAAELHGVFAEARRQDAGAHGMREQRTQREPGDHGRVSSCTIVPSRMLSVRRARRANAGSCVTTTSAVPSAFTRSSSSAICSPVA